MRYGSFRYEYGVGRERSWSPARSLSPQVCRISYIAKKPWRGKEIRRVAGSHPTPPPPRDESVRELVLNGGDEIAAGGRFVQEEAEILAGHARHCAPLGPLLETLLDRWLATAD